MAQKNDLPQTPDMYWQLQLALTTLESELKNELADQARIETSIRRLQNSLKQLFSQQWPKLEIYDE